MVGLNMCDWISCSSPVVLHVPSPLAELQGVITRAPDVHLRRWLVHSAYFFKTKSSSILLMLKSNQITRFWHFEDTQQIQKKIDFPRSRPPARQHQQKGNSCCSKIEAARKATHQQKGGTRIVQFLILWKQQPKNKQHKKRSKETPSSTQSKAPLVHERLRAHTNDH